MKRPLKHVFIHATIVVSALAINIRTRINGLTSSGSVIGDSTIFEDKLRNVAI